jgi:hypothetical protein
VVKECKPVVHTPLLERALQAVMGFIQSLSALLDEKEVGPGSKERTHTPTQQVEDFVDIVYLK